MAKEMIVIQILYNLGLLVASSIVVSTFDRHWKGNSTLGKIITGLIFGIIAIIAMLNPFVLAKGLIFDGRSVVLSIAALFFGPIPAIISWLMAIITRIVLGGAGVYIGSLVITASSIIGLVFYNYKIKYHKINSWFGSQPRN